VGLKVGFSLDQFSEILKVRDVAGKPYILIGGQAVNYWAERYLEREPQLKALGHSPAQILISRARRRMCGALLNNWP
jgi:hypothetical protein